MTGTDSGVKEDATIFEAVPMLGHVSLTGKSGNLTFD